MRQRPLLLGGLPLSCCLDPNQPIVPATSSRSAHSASPRPPRPATAASLQSFVSAENGSTFSGCHGPDRELQSAVAPTSPAEVPDYERSPTLPDATFIATGTARNRDVPVLSTLPNNAMTEQVNYVAEANPRRHFLAIAVQTADRLLASAAQTAALDLQDNEIAAMRDRPRRAARLLGQAVDAAEVVPQSVLYVLFCRKFPSSTACFSGYSCESAAPELDQQL